MNQNSLGQVMRDESSDRTQILPHGIQIQKPAGDLFVIIHKKKVAVDQAATTDYSPEEQKYTPKTENVYYIQCIIN